MISHLFHVISHLFHASADKRNHLCVLVVACHLGRGSTVSWKVPASRVARWVVVIPYLWTVWPWFGPRCFDLNSCLVYIAFSPQHYTLRDPGEIQSREVELDRQVSPEEIMSREVELGCESGTSFASSCSSTAVQRTLSL